MNKVNKLTVGIFLILTLFLGACSEDTPTSPGGGNSSFDAVVASAGSFETIVETSDTLSTDTTINEVVGDEDFFCTSTTVDATESPDEFPLFDVNADLIYPGNLLQGASLDAATPSPIPVDRGPGTVVMIIDNGADSVSRTVPEVSLSSIFNAKNQIIADNPGILPARFSFSFEEIHSREQMSLALDASFKNIATDLQAQLSFSSDKEYNRYIVKLDQSFYTMAFQLPTAKGELFGSNVTPEQLAQYVGPGNPAAFISTVTYGRKFYLLIESTSSSTEIDASINASFGAAVAQGSLGVDAQYISDLTNVRVKAFALGGEQGAALGAVTSDFDSLKTFLAQGGDIRTGVALSYVVRSLASPDQIVGVKVATQYDIVNCVPVGESVENPIVWYKADHGVTTTGTAKLVTVWQNFFGKSEFDAMPPTKAYGGRLISNALPGPNLPAVKFKPLESSSSNEAMLQFPGVNFVGTDFTIWVVARLESEFSNYPENLLWGSGTTTGSSYSLGFRNANQFSATNLHDTLNVSMLEPVNQFKLYTIRFSQTNGMDIFVNGSLTPVVSDPTLTQSLTSFLGARIGSQNGNALYLAEIKGYGAAVSEVQRKSLDKALLIKYGL